MRPPETLPGYSSKWFMVVIFLPLLLGVLALQSFVGLYGMSATGPGLAGFALFLVLDFAVVAIPCLLVALYVPRPATIVAHEEGLVVPSRYQGGGVAVRWKSVAIRGRRAYLYARPWGPPITIALTEHQAKRLEAWTRGTDAVPGARSAADRNPGFRFAPVD